MSKWVVKPAGASRECGRTLCAKTFDMGNGRRKVVQSLKPIHYERDGQLHDIDNTLEVVDGRIVARQMQSPVTFHADSIGYQKGEMRLTLTSLPFVAPRIDGESVVYEWPEQDLSITFHVRRGMVRCVKRLGSERAPKEFRWKLETLGETSLRWNLNVKGHDNADGEQRKAEPRRHQRRDLHIETDTHELPDGAIEFIERWTGKTKERDPRTRVASWSDDAVYPVLIDPPDITESIVADADDGSVRGTGNNWYVNYTYLGGYPSAYQPGWRFQGVAVPQAATIDLAVLKINAVSSASGGGSGTIYGYDIDDAPAWKASPAPWVLPSRIIGYGRGTSASTSITGSTSTGIRSYTVTSIVQEIVNRAGWSSGNDMSLFAVTDPSYSQTTFEDYSAAGTDEALLEIDYTEGATSYILDADSGTFTLTGTAATFDTKMAADSGTFALTGQNAQLQLSTDGPPLGSLGLLGVGR